MARLILFDKRGTGLSDPVPVSELPTLEQRLDDVRAVMEAAGSQRAVLLGVSEGGPLCSLFAATYPEQTEALVMIGSYARRLRDTDYPWGPTREERDAFCQTIIDEWGGPVGIEERAPSRATDPAFRDWWASYLRMGASPGAAVALTRMNAEIDVRERAAVDPRADAGAPPHRRSVPASRRGTLSRVAHSRRRVRRAARATITCRLSAIRTRCCARSSSSLANANPPCGRSGPGVGVDGVVELTPKSGRGEHAAGAGRARSRPGARSLGRVVRSARRRVI